MMLKKTSTYFEALRRRKRARVEHTRDEMHDYQNMAYQFGLQTPFSALFIGLGLGKTVISLTLAIDLLMAGKVKKVLIVE